MSKVVFSFRNFMKRLLSLVICLSCVVGAFFMTTSSQAVASCEYENQVSSINLKKIIKEFFGIREEKKEEKPSRSVYLGGYPLGFTIECDGVMVVAIGKVETESGDITPLQDKNVKVGDVIQKVNGVKLESARDMERVLNTNPMKYYKLLINRKGEIFEEVVSPCVEASSGLYRLGLWIRDNTAGVGTLTYIKDDLRFGALGHTIADIDTGVNLPILRGNIYKCSIVGFNKSTRGNPGELRGLFLRNGENAGQVDSNNDYGVFGSVKQEYLDKNNITRRIEVGSKESVKTGKATLVCTIDGSTPSEYEIEIIKTNYQSQSATKSMVVKITDERLLSQTGGIVQGMSGSPIIQNGKLIGALTHVFVSDATKGFGIYIDWMIDN